jgi:hypothetical protein
MVVVVTRLYWRQQQLRRRSLVVVEWSADQSGLPRTRKGMKRSREYTRRVSALSTAVGNGRIVPVSSSVQRHSRGLV